MLEGCKFCQIIRGDVESRVVFEDEVSLGFLDQRPLFPGHCLLVPKTHYETLVDLPPTLVAPFFSTTQLLARAVECGLKAEGTFIAINIRVSQSVPHLHVHVVPRRKGDGLKGFFWPRHPYKDQETLLEMQDILRSAIERILSE
jgi:histidine triad (HIT) family protein